MLYIYQTLTTQSTRQKSKGNTLTNKIPKGAPQSLL